MILAKAPEGLKAFKISPHDTNKMVLLFDPIEDAANFISVIEIFEVGGRTPPNKHTVGQEMFFVLHGQGRAFGEGDSVIDIRAGDSMLVYPGGWHAIENTGTDKLYCLTVMVPNDGFAEMIHAGTPAELDEADLAVIRAGARGAA